MLSVVDVVENDDDVGRRHFLNIYCSRIVRFLA